MRVAALYDIHGNLPALEAVLGEIRELGVDLMIIGGDVVPGPMPGEALAALGGLPAPALFLYGNGERDVLSARHGRALDRVPEGVYEVLRWVAETLTPAAAELLREWPGTVRLEVEGSGDVLFCHATPRSDAEIFTSRTPEECLRPIFDPVHADVVVCGHTHMQFDRRIGNVRVVNAGSVGMPFGEPGAYWALLDSGVEPKRTDYDLERAAERIRGTDYPQADEFAAVNVLRPPSEADMLERFERAALR